MVLGSILKLIIVFILLCYSNLALIGSIFIDTDTCPWLLLHTVYGVYPNRTYVFSHHIGFRKVVTRVPVGRAYFPSVIDKFLFTTVLKGVYIGIDRISVR